jgi:hypothetical protein
MRTYAPIKSPIAEGGGMKLLKRVRVVEPAKPE